MAEGGCGLMGRWRDAERVHIKDPFGMRMVLALGPQAEPFLSYTDEQLELGWRLYGDGLMEGRDPEELWGWRRFGAGRS